MATSSRSDRRPRRRLPPTERREELLDAAVEVLSDQGPTGVKVEDITNAAGTAKGNFYRYFASVDELLVAVRDHLLDQYIAALVARREANPDAGWWQVIDDEAHRFLDYHVGLGPLHDVLFHSPAADAHPPSRERSAGLLLGELIAAGAADGSFRADDPETLGELLFHTLHGAADTIRSGADRDRVETSLLQILRSALGVAQ